MEMTMGEMSAPTLTQSADSRGTRDGDGAADHDTEYRFGRRPHAGAPYPFSTHQYIRLLLLRSRVQAGLVGADDCEDAHPVVFLPDGIWLASASDLLVAQDR
jgi:hypothetical protein